MKLGTIGKDWSHVTEWNLISTASATFLNDAMHAIKTRHAFGRILNDFIIVTYVVLIWCPINKSRFDESRIVLPLQTKEC